MGQTETLEESVLDNRELFGASMVDPPRSVGGNPVQQAELSQAVDDHG
jgi:hypothetical protein